MTAHNASLAELFMLTRAQHRLTLTETAGDITSISSISRFESNQQMLSNATFGSLMNQVGLARQDVNNLMYANQNLPFLTAHNTISELIAKGHFEKAEAVATAYEQTAMHSGNQLAKINSIELRAKIRRRRDGDYQLNREDEKLVIQFFNHTNAQWTDHDYELFAHIATSIPLAESFAIYRSISALFRADAIAPGYITSLIFCTRNLLLKAIAEQQNDIVTYLREDLERIELVPTTSDVDVYFMAITRNLGIKLADYALQANNATQKAAKRAITLARELLGNAAVGQANLVFETLLNHEQLELGD
jgi:hypothetical protein